MVRNGISSSFHVNMAKSSPVLVQFHAAYKRSFMLEFQVMHSKTIGFYMKVFYLKPPNFPFVLLIMFKER